MFATSAESGMPSPKGLPFVSESFYEKFIESPPNLDEFFRGRLANFGGIKFFPPKSSI
jgi:hypothetical protein